MATGNTTFNVDVSVTETTETSTDLIMGADDIRQMFVDRGIAITANTTISIFAYTANGGKRLVGDLLTSNVSDNALLFTAKSTAIVVDGVPAP